MRIIPLSEGSFTVDKTKVFVPYDEEQHELQDRSRGSLLVEVQPFVIITSNDILLLDTGLGFSKENGELQLHRNLMNAGIEPASITKVLISHLHKDHAGGVSMQEVKGSPVLSFPGATYYLQRKEFDNAISRGKPSYITEEFEMLGNSPNVIFLDGDGSIDNYIHYEITAAHSLFHQVFRIEEVDEKIFFGADDAPQLQQMKHKFVAKYDHDGKKAAALRSEWWQRGRKEGWTFLFYHDIKHAVYR